MILNPSFSRVGDLRQAADADLSKTLAPDLLNKARKSLDAEKAHYENLEKEANR
jgi:hypothetical protein